ncbi:S8 family peptidase [Paenibacillus cymbidii]|uniref:S8 family peptidase n=1 Tax=Paenibacillus cymbidii TaxID=1639034 RepID=UPI0010804CCC|nr:S8 family peptidase [Paenibacillus cymbidii]
MKRSVVAGAAIAGLVLLLLPSNSHRGGGGAEQSSDQPSERTLTAAQELAAKQSLVSGDVERTDGLCRNQCRLDLRQTLAAIRTSGDPATAVRQLRSERAHMAHVMYLRSGETPNAGVVAGELSPEAQAAAAPYIAEARQKAAAAQAYESPKLDVRGDALFVLAEPAEGGNEALIAVVRQDILRQVHAHQMKNLRVVPYPPDNNWTIESVDSDTLRDVKVEHPEENEGTSHYHKNEVVVKFRTAPTDAELRQMQADTGASSVRKLGYTYVFRSGTMEAKQLMAYFQTKNVEYAEPHFLYMTNSLGSGSGRAAAGSSPSPAADKASGPNDVLYAKYQWNLPIIDTLSGWDVGKGSSEVTVAVIDTGVDLAHPDLQGHLASGLNVIHEDADPIDDVGHGTHVAGVISALVNNGEGVAGMTWYNPVMPVKVLDETGAGNTYAVSQGIIWAADHGAKVINLSLGNYAEASFLHDAIKYAYDKDVVIVAASGNDNTDEPGYPAAYPEVLAVAAIDANQRKAAFSNYGDYIDVAAPGVSIASTYMHKQYAALSGTSMASPHAAALAALIRSVNPQLKNTEVMDIMKQTAIDLGPAGKDDYFGYGQIDVAKALEWAKNGTTASSARSADKPADAAPTWWRRLVGGAVE